MLAALFPKADGAVQAGCHGTAHTQGLCPSKQTTPWNWAICPGDSPGHSWHFLSSRGLLFSLPRVRSKAGCGVQAQTLWLGSLVSRPELLICICSVLPYTARSGV